MTDTDEMKVQESFTDETLGVSGEDGGDQGPLARLSPEMRETLHKAQERFGDVSTKARALVKDKPLVAVGAAVVAGFIVGRIASRI